MRRVSVLVLLLATVTSLMAAPAASATPRSARVTARRTSSAKVSGRVVESSSARKRMAGAQHSRPVANTRVSRAKSGRVVRTASVVRVHGRLVRRASIVVPRRRRSYERFSGNSFAETDLTVGDVTAGEDPVVRQAAIDALGEMNGTVVAIDPSNGRVLAMVNQKLALSSGAEPCSTIKVSVALAALEEGIITKDTPVNLGGSYHLTLTEALAHSNNLYFETLGRRLGFERMKHYANEFGLGELAGYDIPGEQLGTYPEEVLPESQGGVGRMCSFGEGVSMTPLQLGALVASIANGGTLYYLQHPTTPEQVLNYQPHVKRTLNIGPLVQEITPGMGAAVQYGTARSLRTSFNEFPVLGKTGTCSNNGTRFGWFASYADTSYGRIVAVFFLEGGRPTFGPKAAELAGHFYRGLWDKSYFAQKAAPESVNTGSVNGITQ